MIERITSLRARIIALLAFAVLTVQVTSIYLLMDERYFLNTAQQVDDALHGFVATAALLEETPEYLHADVLRTHSDSRQLFSLQNESKLTADDESGWAVALEDIYLDYLDKTDFSISEPIIKVENHAESDERYATIITIEAQLSQGDYLLGQFQPLSAPLSLQYRLSALLFMSLLLAYGLTSIFMVSLTRPLKNLTQAAQDFGSGKKIRPLSETGASDIRQATRAFNEMQRQLVDALRGQQHMLAAIGHDLRTPLTSLRVRAETLPDSREREKIITKTEEMAATLEAILEFAKAQADDHSLDFHSIDLASLLQDLCQDYQTAKKQIKLDVQENIDLMGSAANLKRALRNIIDNGLFYGTAVSLTLGLSETHAIITIDDDGPGVGADMLDKLTAPFFRIDKSRNSESGGIGMGLALAKSVIEHHQGTLQFQNIENGFRATIALPLTVS